MTFTPQPAPDQSTGDAEEPYPMPSSQPMLLRGVKWGSIATVLSMIVFAIIGSLAAGAEGMWGGLIGAAIGGILLLITVGSIAFANRFVASPLYLQLFFAVVLGAWVIKIIAFVVAALLLRDQPWLQPQMLFIALVSTIVVSIVIDTIIVAKARVPYVS